MLAVVLAARGSGEITEWIMLGNISLSRMATIRSNLSYQFTLPAAFTQQKTTKKHHIIKN
jgi:hypothetical protein